MKHLDMTSPLVIEAYEKLKKSATTMQGTNFALLMSKETDEGLSLEVFERPRQPCQGGEMRKYESTHPGDCTRPKDGRPGDLRMPFPGGTPEAVAVCFLHYSTYHHPVHTKASLEEYDQYVETVFGAEGLYTPMLGGADSIEKIRDESGCVSGIIFTDTDVDPTVLVNSLQYFRSFSPRSLQVLLDLGFSPKESQVIMMMTNHCAPKTFGHPYAYYFSSTPSLRRLFEHDPNDLTGGTFRNRFDYNRPEIQDLFKATGDDLPLDWAKATGRIFQELTGKPPMEPKTYKSNVTPETFKETVQQVLKQYYYDNGGLISNTRKEAA